MKKIIILLLVTVVFVGCEKKVAISEINTINGYWQISKAIDMDGNKKDYPINEIYDYFEIKNKIGFHKKVVWQPDGTFLVNDLQDIVNASVNDGGVYLDFESKYGKHQDHLKSLSSTEMILESSEKITFYYTKVIVKSKK